MAYMPGVQSHMAGIDYPRLLSDCWQQHLAPRADNAPTVISTFAGCGGSSLGYSMAGYEELLAVEWDDNAVETFKLNFPGVPVYHDDIAKLSVGECLSLAGIESGELDVLDGSPPCQGFSTAGKRNMSDDRNQLFREYVRLLRGLKPKVFVMENVSGMAQRGMRVIFAEVIRELKASGYQVICKQLNSKHYFVPQSRKRLIFIGVRDDLGIQPPYPAKSIDAIAAYNAVDISLETNGYVTASNERHTRENRRPLSKLIWPAPTLVKTGNSKMLMTGEIVPLSKHETMRFGSFPDSFQFNGEWRGQIGNSVPPLFMKAIADAIRLTLDQRD